jgi:hypothetical protein
VTPRPKVVRVAPLLFSRSVNVKACPLAGLPEPSVTVAVTMVLWPAERDVEAAVKLIRNPVPAVELDILVMMTTAVDPVTLACILSWTATLELLAPAV